MSESLSIEGIKIPQNPDITVDLSPKGFMPWSYSKLSCLRKCPLQFYLKYILKAKLEISENKYIRDKGKAAHRILELIIMGKPVQKAFKITKDEYVPKYLSSEEWEEGVESLEYSINSFKEKLEQFEQNNSVKRYLQELQIGVTIDWQPTGFWSEDCFFRGVIDLAIQICLSEDLEIYDAVFIDHKTGAPSIMGIKNFQFQLDIYKLLFHYGICKVEGASSGIHFISDGETKIGDYSTKQQIETTIRNHLEFAIETAITTVIDLGFFKHKRGSHCKWCDYDGPCKNKSLSEIENSSKKWFSIKQVD